jgi:hypothetical protein
MRFTTLVIMSLLLAHFYQINEQFISFQNYFGVLTRLCQGKVARHFLISNVSAGNATLCRGQHVVRVPQVEWASAIRTGEHQSKQQSG